ncbi:ADP-ribosyl-(dinitrogen reductase) hydrolase [Stenotrophomonas humi]|uniref:ADP-ribosyl-(Dinitrogen reductase) hydrolase n=1 Tax=Stenotrophomonas humi TaxID=405444 RepID=A0A0R0CBX5_9GAMM|nr:hypothetical protein [Stenotrophomonas humi]KRG64010.1 ADP-ribosyl-(dinitrogen reductase) hydrolase [Stenotrophomonas humi]
MAQIIISKEISRKLSSKHGVSEVDVHQCFANITGQLLVDLREEHKTDPRTIWFIAPTNKGRLLKVCYVPRGDFYIRTCYPPNDAEMAIYRKHGKPTDF